MGEVRFDDMVLNTEDAKLYLCELTEVDGMSVSIHKPQEIQFVPELIQGLISEVFKDFRQLNDSGLPTVFFVGENEFKVIGWFKYGALGFIECIGTPPEKEDLMVIYPYKEASYEELMDGKEDYIKERALRGTDLKPGFKKRPVDASHDGVIKVDSEVTQE